MRTIPAKPAAPATGQTGGHAAPATRPAAPAPPPRWDGQDILALPETAQVAFAAWSGDPAVVVESPPGAGKTRLVLLLAAHLAHRSGLHIGIATQTRDQAIELARRAGQVTSLAKLLLSAKPGQHPATGATPIVAASRAHFPATGGGILIATASRWRFADPRELGCDLMIVDEAFQCTYADLGALGAFAGQIVCVGDPGQIDPVVTGSTARWQHSAHGPHIPAPAALLDAHGDAINVIALPHTWRLGPDTTALIQPAFYPAMRFTSRRPPEHAATPAGATLPEIAHLPVASTAGPADPVLAAACAGRVHDLLDGHTITDAAGTRPVSEQDIAVVTAHVAQAAAVRAMLAGQPDVLVGTANQLQGLERPAVVALYPLAGYRDLATASVTDAGRACVMLTRHRAHLTVVTDTATAAVLAAADSPTGHHSVYPAILATPAV